MNLFKDTSILKFLLCFVIFAFSSEVKGQEQWNGKKAAVSLTYDDSVDEQLDNAIPALNDRGFKATFYLTTYYPGFKDRINEWAEAANSGHELGNHTLFHPCESSKEGRGWVSPEYDLDSYTVRRAVEEIKMANVILNLTDAESSRTFAYPCGDINAGGMNYVDDIRSEFTAARGITERTEHLGNIDLFEIGAMGISGQTSEELISYVDKAIEEGSLVVFLFHGVGGGHGQDVSLEAHTALLDYLKAHEDELWIGTMEEIANFIKSEQQ